MSFISDLRGVSEAALSQLTDRFGDLPRPLLAAIGAGDFAVERLAELREALTDSLEKSTHPAGDAREFAADLPSKMQDAAAEVFESVQKFATDVPARTQHLVEQLPERVTDIREALSPEQLKGAVEGYTQLAGVIYGSLAERGDKKWAGVVAAAGHDGKVIDGGVAAPTPAPTPPAAPSARPAPTAFTEPGTGPFVTPATAPAPKPDSTFVEPGTGPLSTPAGVPPVKAKRAPAADRAAKPTVTPTPRASTPRRAAPKPATSRAPKPTVEGD